MAQPPKPYDLLTLLFETAELGGFEHCQFQLPAGCDQPWDRERSTRSLWVDCGCLYVYDNQGSRRHGASAVEAIASQQLSIQNVMQIVRWRPITLCTECECYVCSYRRQRSRTTAAIADMIPASPGDPT